MLGVNNNNVVFNGNELLNIFSTHLDSKYLSKTALVSKDWFDKVKATLLTRQKSSLPESFKALEGKKLMISNYIGDGCLSLVIDPVKTVFTLNSLEKAKGEFEEYSLMIDEGKPLQLDSWSSRDGKNKIFCCPALNLFFSTIEESLKTAKITGKHIEITGLDQYLIKAHWRINSFYW